MLPSQYLQSAACPPHNSGPSKAQDSVTSVHTPNCSHKNFTPRQRQPKNPTRRPMPLLQLQTRTSAKGFRLGSDIYSVGLYLWLLYNTAVNSQTEKYGRTWKGKHVDQEDKGNLYTSRYEKKHRTQHGLRQCCRSTTPSVSATVVTCSLRKDYVFFIFLKSSLSQSILPVL